MISKLIVFGAGYVLGSKAGRERYNQIARMAQEMARRLDEYGGQDRLSAASSRRRSRAGSRSSGKA